VDEVFNLLIGGIPIAVGVFLGVQGLKVYGFVSGESAAKAAIIIAIVLGLGWVSGELFPVAAQYIVLAYQTFLGAMTAGLFYEYIAAPFFEKIGVSLRSE